MLVVSVFSVVSVTVVEVVVVTVVETSAGYSVVVAVSVRVVVAVEVWGLRVVVQGLRLTVTVFLTMRTRVRVQSTL